MRFKNQITGIKRLRKYFLFVFFISQFGQCVTVPKDYVPDEKVVYLRQRVDLEPIKYEPAPADPYEFSAEPEINPEEPQFLKSKRFTDYLTPDYSADVQLYNEVKEHLLWVEHSENLNDLIQRIESGKNVQRLTNGVSVKTELGELTRLKGSSKYIPDQYQYKPAEKEYNYIFFFTSGEGPDFQEANSIAVFSKYGMRFTYDRDMDQVAVYAEGQVVILGSNYQKHHYEFSMTTHRQGGLISYYLPEGIRITGFNGARTLTRLEPNWPEGYAKESIGPYTFSYVEKDAPYLEQINADLLKHISEITKNKTGLLPGGSTQVVLPPSLESYTRLNVVEKNQLIQWFPSGFQTKGIIVMWPPSVPKYKHPDGESYYWSREFYETLIHEYVHEVIFENTNGFSPIPVWLNEGLAVVVECEFSPVAKAYWDTTFLGDVALKKKMPWDEITVNSTGSYPVAQARVHYAQSYKMTQYLIETYGSRKLGEYIRSFTIEMGVGEVTVNLAQAYKENFQKIYGITWEENVRKFSEALGY